MYNVIFQQIATSGNLGTSNYLIVELNSNNQHVQYAHSNLHVGPINFGHVMLAGLYRLGHMTLSDGWLGLQVVGTAGKEPVDLACQTVALRVHCLSQVACEVRNGNHRREGRSDEMTSIVGKMA